MEHGPLTTAAISQAVLIIQSVIDRLNVGKEDKDKGKHQAHKILVDILMNSEIAAWIAQAGDKDLRDRRTCTLVVSIARFYDNAHQSWLTPSDHKKYYSALAANLRRDHLALRANRALRAPPDVLDYLMRTASFVDSVAEHPDAWTQSRPYHADAARNDFMRELVDWFKQIDGKPRHGLTLEVASFLFKLPDGFDVTDVQSICR